MAKFTVHIVHQVNGEVRPSVGRRVRISFHGLTGGLTESVKTNQKGIAHFESRRDGGKCTIYVDGDEVMEAYFADGESVTINEESL